MRFTFFLCMSFIASVFHVNGKERYLALSKGNLKFRTDSVVTDSSKTDLLPDKPGANSRSKSASPQEITIIRPKDFNFFPGTSLQQYLKGQAAGVYVQEPSGEPGTLQNMFIHGSALPLISVYELEQTQPLIVIDGVPLISRESPFAYDFKQYKFNRVGPATNLLAGIQPENIASIEVVTDPIEKARYGARAGNGIIYIKTKKPTIDRQITVNSYVGLATPLNVATLNGASESNFRKPFYDRYASFDQKQNIPAYLGDSLYNIYYGPSNWTDTYYKKSMVYGIDGSASGGNSRSNFRVSIGNQQSKAGADGTGLDRYSAAFSMNMIPLKGLNVSTVLNASQLVRQRNKNLRDRFAELQYIPNVTNPPAPNKEYYNKYITESDRSFDKNRNNIVNGYLSASMAVGKLTLSTRFSADYSEGFRDVFYPSTLMENNSYVSNYFGYNQRIAVDNSVSYKLSANTNNKLSFELGQSLQWDQFKYSYANAYRGSSDYIKINLLKDPKGNYAAALFSYQANNGFLNSLTYRYIDLLKTTLVSFYGLASYSYKDKYFLSAMLREDASSTAQPTNRWFLSPTVSARWNAKKDIFADSKLISNLDISLGFSRLGRVFTDDKFAAGPSYLSDIGYSGETTIGTFSGVATLNRPYTKGWVGYNVPWAHSDEITGGVSLGLFNNRINAAVGFYSRSDNDQIFSLPINIEYGYDKSLESGLDVNNRGLDINLTTQAFKPSSKFKWTSSVNLNFNKNKLLALPKGYNELVVGSRMLKVGEPIDAYWLYTNEGIYTDESQIPVNPQTGKKLSISGIELSVGDPKWKDYNGDYVLDKQDKVLKGHALPVLTGGFSNTFAYKKLDFSFNLYFNLGRDIINEEMSKRFDFVNNQSANNVSAIKEVTFWEKRGDYSKYPIYNPWSSVVPYRTDQDLFLENGSFVKLRAVTVGYDFTGFLKKKGAVAERNLKGYITVNNLFTITPYSGRDPELVDYTGYNTGYGLTLPPTYTIGFKYIL